MITIKVFLDTRRAKSDGTFPVKFRIYHKGNSFFISLPLSAKPDEFSNGQFIKRNLDNRLIQNRIAAIVDIVQPLEISGDLDKMTIKEVKEFIEISQHPEKAKPKRVFIDAMEDYLETVKADNTKELYRQTIDKIIAFDPMATYETITKDWLRRFELSPGMKNLAVNTRSVHLRNIRCVFNYAIDMEETTLYPFRRYQIKQQKTRHRNLTLEQLRAIMNNECEPCQRDAVDFFMLSFYLIGMNPADILRGNASIHNGRIEYNRLKTQRYYSIKIEPEADAILKKHKNWLSGSMSVTECRTFLYKINRSLKKLSWTPITRTGLGGKKNREPIEKDISLYWARHTWATLASELDIPKDVISASLGHSSGSVTDVYINFDNKKIDSANRKVIDYVKGEA